MKFPAKIALALGAVIAVLALVVALAFLPSVQKWAIKRGMSGTPGTTIEIDHVAAGMRSAEVRNLSIQQDGALIRVPSARAEYSAWDYLKGGGIQVGRIEAKGLVVDLRNYAPSGAATPASKGFEGILGAILLPAELRLEAADIDAEVILPSPTSPEGQRLRLTVKGGGIGAGREAAFEYKAQFTDPAKGAMVSAANATGRLTMKSGQDGLIGQLVAQAEAQAEGDKIPLGERLVLFASAQRGTDKRETMELKVSRRGASGPETMLLNVSAVINAASGVLDGTWSVSVDNERLAAVLAAGSTPDFDVHGEGRFSLNPQTGASQASGDIKGSLAKLERVMPELAEVGSLGFSAAFSGAADSSAVRLDTLRSQVSTPSGKVLFSLETLQVISFNPGSGRVEFADAATDLARMEMNGVPTAWVAPFVAGLKVSGGEISGGFLVQANPSGDRVRIRPTHPFAIRGVTVADESRTLLDRATVTASAELIYSAERIEAAVDSWTLSTVAGDRIDGKATVTLVSGPEMNAKFMLSVAGTLPALLKPFSPVDVGTVAIAGGVEGSMAGDNVTLNTATLGVRNSAGTILFEGQASQPLQLNLATATAKVAKPDEPAISVTFGVVPLGWIEPFVAGSKLSGSVEGGAADLFIAADGYGISTRSPISVKGVSVVMDGKALADRIDGSWDGSASLKGNSIASTIRKMEVRQGPVALLTVSGVFEATGIDDPAKAKGSAKGSLEANLGLLLAQPAAAEFRHLEAGRLTADFDLKSDSAVSARMQVSAAGLVAREDRKALGDWVIGVEGKLQPDHSGEFRVPINVQNAGRKSDLLLVGTLSKRGEVFVVTGKATGDRVVVEDFEALAALASSGGSKPVASSPASTAKNTTRDEKPVWDGVEGSFELDIKSLVQNTDYPITNLVARAVITPDRIALEKFEGRTAGNPLTASGALGFERRAPRPYVIDGRFKVPGFDTAALFRATAPNTPPMVEGIVAAEGTFSGRGLNIEDLLGRVQGRVDIAGGKGVYRGLARSSERISTGAGLVGALFGGQKVQDATQAVSELAGELRELKYDRMTVKVARGEDLKLNIETLELVSPYLRLTGRGVINMDPDVPLVKQAQRLEMRLGFKESLGERMVARRMTDGTVDDLGYARFRVPIVLTGNLLTPDSKQFWEAVTRSMIEMGVQSFLPGG